MCGRVVLERSREELMEHFQAEASERLQESMAPDYNVAPSQEVYVVVNHRRERTLGTMQWGLVPRFATDASIGARMTNARAETVREKPSYREALRRRRCLIPVDGFYEWQRIDGQKVKQPWYIYSAKADQPLAFAGLWDSWRNPQQSDSDPLVTCTIITTEANDDMAEIHHRMPLVLEQENWSEWLDGRADLGVTLQPPQSGSLRRHKVSTAVNSVRNKGPELIAAAADVRQSENSFLYDGPIWNGNT